MDISSAVRTGAFCDKVYVVITMLRYYEIDETHAKNEYVDIFVDMEKTVDSATYLNYDRVESKPNGFIEFEMLKNSIVIKYKCVDNKLTFEYSCFSNNRSGCYGLE